jgi:hypothetical protein
MHKSGTPTVEGHELEDDISEVGDDPVDAPRTTSLSADFSNPIPGLTGVVSVLLDSNIDDRTVKQQVLGKSEAVFLMLTSCALRR